MVRGLDSLRAEMRPMLRLALPVALGELAWMAMGVVDTLMLGRVNAEAVGAMSIGRMLFMTAGVAGIGMLLGLDTLVSRAFGAGDLKRGRLVLVQGVYLGLLLALPLTLLYRSSSRLLGPLGIQGEVLGSTVSYMHAVSWAILPLLMYTAFRRYLQAVNLVRSVALALVTANLVNLAGNWMLIFGHAGAPALGAAGAGWATLIAISYMALFLLAAVLLDLHGAGGLPFPSLRIDPAGLRALLALGFPASIQLVLEIGVVALMGVLAGRLDPVSLAAHQIALVLASVTFMVPLGISSACAVRVGQALGRGDPQGASRAGWTAMLIATSFMALAALTFVALPRPLIRLFTADPRVIATGASLLLIAAVFQLADGISVSATGALRGTGDTHSPMLAMLIGYWIVALPLGHQLCFRFGLGVTGLWIGLSAGLILVSLALPVMWARCVRGLVHRR